MSSRVLLVGPPQVGKTRLGMKMCKEDGFYYLNLDPSRQDIAPLSTVSLYAPGGKSLGFHFIGSLSLWKKPLAAVTALLWGVREANASPLVVEVTLEPTTSQQTDLYRNLTTLLLPEKIIGIGFEGVGSILLPHAECRIEVRPPLEGSERRPENVLTAWRNACWKTYFTNSKELDISLRDVAFLGARFRSGIPLEVAELNTLHEMGFKEASYAEIIGDYLYIVSQEKNGGRKMSNALRFFGCKKGILVHPALFRGLIIGLEQANGWHVAVGRIQAMEFDKEMVRILTPIDAEAAISKIHIGRVRLDPEFRELGELRAWQV
ncbi:MAG TPA: hypothetical protein VNK96_05655 [Fimbriimonadales bacterium]|nr:hypothetical protein [Fimbriimonadales bacterium]